MMQKLQILDATGGRIVKGGPGSGFHGHAGRPGEVGGSAPAGTTNPNFEGENLEQAEFPFLDDYIDKSYVRFPTEEELDNAIWKRFGSGSVAANIWKVTLEDGSKWFVKQPSDFFADWDLDEAGNELAAYKLAKALEIPSVPVAIITPESESILDMMNEDGSDDLLISPWIDEAVVFRDVSGDPYEEDGYINEASADTLLKIELFDYLIRNTDRHIGNIMFGYDYQPFMIDNGASFHENGYYNPPFHQYSLKVTADKPIGQDTLDWLYNGIEAAIDADDGSSADQLQFAQRRLENLEIAASSLIGDEIGMLQGTVKWRELRDHLV